MKRYQSRKGVWGRLLWMAGLARVVDVSLGVGDV